MPDLRMIMKQVMKAGILYLMLLFLPGASCWADVVTQRATGPSVQDLGDGRYQVGAIEVNKNDRRFSVPGVVIKLEPQDGPVEFLAVTKGGMKSYEAILEIDTDAIAFNLACIMIGLDSKDATSTQQHFDPRPVQGDRVNIYVSWQHNGKLVRISGADAVKVSGAKAAAHEWIYTGSFFSPDGGYMAEVAGTLVGFVHDMDSIIQHRQGLGLGDYGAVQFNAAVMPPAGTPVTLSIERSAD